MTASTAAALRKLVSAAKNAIRQTDPADRCADFVRLVEFLESDVVRPPCENCGKRTVNRDAEGMGLDESPLCRACTATLDR